MSDEGIVGFFIGDWYVFSNFAPLQIKWRGKNYATSEHAYQAAHFFETDSEISEEIRQCRSPIEAFTLANSKTALEDPDWADKKLGIMEEILRQKIEQHSIVKEKLIQTKDKLIIEMNDDDSFWGWGSDHKGQNHLGKLWMKLRDEIPY